MSCVYLLYFLLILLEIYSRIYFNYFIKMLVNIFIIVSSKATVSVAEQWQNC